MPADPKRKPIADYSESGAAVYELPDNNIKRWRRAFRSDPPRNAYAMQLVLDTKDAMLAVYKVLQRDKFWEGVARNSDVGLNETLGRFRENNLLGKMIAEADINNPICRDGLAGFVEYAINRMEYDPVVTWLRGERSYNGTPTDVLTVIPGYVKHNNFAPFVLAARTEYCGAKCAGMMQCVSAADLHKDIGQQYFG